MALIRYKPFNHIIAGTSDRNGGVSQEPYDTFNGALTVADSSLNVIQNRQRLAEKVGIPLSNWVFCRQCHSDQIRKVTSFDHGRGAFDHEEGIRDCDALYTFEDNLVLAFVHADCVPILLVDPVKHMIAAIHAGWSGTLKEITRKSLEELINKEGIDPKNLKAYLGPALSYESSLITENVLPYLEKMSFDASEFVTLYPQNQAKIDTRGLNIKMLTDAGVLEKNITNLDIDTYINDELFFSYQRQSVTGRHITFIAQCPQE